MKGGSIRPRVGSNVVRTEMNENIVRMVEINANGVKTEINDNEVMRVTENN